MIYKNVPVVADHWYVWHLEQNADGVSDDSAHWFDRIVAGPFHCEAHAAQVRRDHARREELFVALATPRDEEHWKSLACAGAPEVDTISDTTPIV